MPLDGIVINTIIDEFQTKLVGGRIDKVYQPERDELLITIRNQNENFRLLLSASPNHPRAHLTNFNKINPEQPPMFCMLLRKHIIGGRLLSISQPAFERIIEFVIESIDELGEMTSKKLIIEIMGRHSNIILVNQKGIIIDSAKHVTEEISRVREILPGLQYQYPPSQEKSDPISISQDELYQSLSSNTKNVRLDKLLSGLLTGVSLVSAQEMVFRSLGDTQLYFDHVSSEQLWGLCKEVLSFFEQIKFKQFSPVLYKDKDGNPLDFFSFIYFSFPQELQEIRSSISDALDQFYYLRDKKVRLSQKTANIHRLLHNNLDRCYKKLGLQEQTLLDASKSEEYKLFGELLTANIYQIKKGSKMASVINYYSDDGSFINIPLDPRRNAVENAQHYYKLYSKAKTAIEITSRQIEENKLEISYLEGQLDNLEKCTEEAEINEIREELMKEGYIKSYSSKKGKRSLPPSKPYHYISSQGYDIYVGKNNHQNDQLTLKFAHPDDMWLHTKDIPGSHVIIKLEGRVLPDQTLKEAGLLAAYFSKGRLSSNVPVDYTYRKYVKKPGGAKPGMVIYVNNKTLYVTPKEESIKGLQIAD